ncbi:MAG: hypothetical protein RRB22_09465 [Gammaproteobacteria bacterium]|nr:hypothetical protein [Gammaproteobacteria bacterium]
MDSTTQFAEYLPNLISTRITQDRDKAAITKKPMRPDHATWRAFQAGMQALQNYAQRSAANPRAIAKANLQLLHRSLLRDPAYIQSLKNASNSMGGYRLPASYCIFEDNHLRAELINLQSGTTIQLKSQPGSYAIYLSIRGNPSLYRPDSTTSARNHWWDRYRQTKHEEFLKNEAAVFISSLQKSTEMLTATTKECILLRIQISGASLD